VSDNNNGQTPPSLANLHKLAGMLPKMGKLLDQENRQQKSILIGSVTKPRKICKICLALFDRAATTPDAVPEPGVCKKHQKMLDEGYTAFVSGDRFAIGRSKRLADMAGQIVQVDGPTMDCLKEYGMKIEQQGEQKQEPDE
jgi:hypothetical protein